MKTLVIINPNSGRGKSLKIFNKYRSILENLYDMTYFVSNYKRHVYDFFREHIDEIKQNKLIIGIGGDGIFFEILNCLKIHNLSIPIAEIPCGTSNGYFKSITNEDSKTNSVSEAITILKNNNIQKMDLLEITNLNLNARLSITWGIISNIDIKTEWLRKLGSFRYDLGAVLNILFKPSYKGTLSYLNKDNQTTTITDEFVFFWACNVAYASCNVHSAPGSHSQDGYIYISYILKNVSRCELINIMLSLASGKFIEHPKVNYIKTTEFTLDTKKGMIVIDGELINHNKIQVKCKPQNLLQLR